MPEGTAMSPSEHARETRARKTVQDFQQLLDTDGAAPKTCCGLPRDACLAFCAKGVRTFNYGAIAPVFFSYVLGGGMSERDVGLLLTAIMLGDLLITLVLTTRADAIGRRATLVVGSLLKVVAAIAFVSSDRFAVLVLAGTVGVISTSGGEIGPFVAIEQACLTDSLAAAEGRERATGHVAVLFGWYNALGSAATALGALASGFALRGLTAAAWGPQLARRDAERLLFLNYGLLGGLLACVYAGLSPACEARPTAVAAAAGGGGRGGWWRLLTPNLSLGLRRPESKFIVARLSALFALDAFAGSFVMQAWVAHWFARRWGLGPELIGSWLAAANAVAGISALAAAYCVARFGAMLTMVASHLPSNILLALVPLMPSGGSAGAMLVARFSISQMDVPARQAYVQMVVASDERSAAGGITNIVRSLGASLSPVLLGALAAAPPGSAAFSAPWLIAGGLKIVYDVVLYSLYRCGTRMRAHEAAAARKDVDEAAEVARDGLRADDEAAEAARDDDRRASESDAEPEGGDATRDVRHAAA